MLKYSEYCITPLSTPTHMGKEEGTKYDIKKESNKGGKREQKCCSVDFLEEKKKRKDLCRFATNIRLCGSNLMCKPHSYFRKTNLYPI